MATIAFAVAAAAAAPELGFALGSLEASALIAGATAVGSYVDSFLLSALAGPTKRVGPKLQNQTPLASIEGDPILRCFGRSRMSGTIIWSSRFLETTTTTTTSSGGGGKGGGGGGAQSTETTTYDYSVSIAVGLCEGPITRVNRIWADGKILDVTNITYRIYYGNSSQGADPKIQAVEGAGVTPAFRGLAYIVFEDLPLADYGNRIPQFSFEVWSPAVTDGSNLENRIPGVCITPGAGEYVYSPEIVASSTAFNGGLENCTNDLGLSNWQVSMDQMQGTLTSLQKVNLVVSWFGTDLRAGNCLIRPEVEISNKSLNNSTYNWQVSGVSRGSASVVSQDADGPLLGGTPTDLSVFQAIQDLQNSPLGSDGYRPILNTSPQAYDEGRGLRVGFYPFILMDIPATNTLPNPYSNSAGTDGQETFPWRGRITVSPAAGFTGTVDKTSTAATQINAFFGSCTASDFGSWDGGTIPYHGSDGFTYRRFILHYAKLCIAAGGVDTFFIGSELRTLLQGRSDDTTFPAVAKMVTLAADVKAMFVGAGFTSTKVTYTADWSEWNNYRPGDGSNDVLFHLDPLWSSSNIDYISIDNYIPLSDWRDTATELDYQNYNTIYDQAYLQSNIEGGEDYDWYYASTDDRVNQNRTTIFDGNSPEEDWIFRNKDFRNWWLNTHHDRPGGARNSGTTNWVAQSKPIIFSELGCPAINKGSNQPNVFYDPKSGESAVPYFSSGTRDDVISRAYIQAQLDYWDPTSGNNPTSTVYSAPMIKTSEICIWNWDARPYPDFPVRGDFWRDAPNYSFGHWLNGRAGQCALEDLIPRICAGLGVNVDASKLYGLVIGYTLDRIMSARDAIEPLGTTYFFDPYVSGGEVKFRHRGNKPDWTINDTQLIPISDSGDTSGSASGESYQVYTVQRTSDFELPGQSTIKYTDEWRDYQQAVVLQRRLIGASNVSADSTLGIVSLEALMQQTCDVTLQDAWLMRETVTCVFPPQFLGMDAADVIELTLAGVTQQYRVSEVDYAFSRQATLVRTDEGLYFSSPIPTSTLALNTNATAIPAVLDFVECPITADAQTTYGPYFRVFSDPWQAVAIYESATTSSYAIDVVATTQAAIGVVIGSVAAGPEDQWDMGNSITVTMSSNNTLVSADDLTVFAGNNVAAIKTNNGGWEIVQWANATLTSGTTYKLTRLLRARLGTETEMNSGIPDQAEFVVLNTTRQSTVGLGDFNLLLNWKWGPSTRALSDPTYQNTTYAPKMIGLRPYSPVHLAAVAGPSTNDITMTWFRRTRYPEQGDNWDLVEVPLAETVESYDVEIYSGSTLKRTFFSLTSPTVTYTAAEQVTDFGSTQTSIKFTVYQNSGTYGRGTGRTITFSKIPGTS